jgi:demethylmenaquinone methyltransferase/2-methoxy-6-polyprenyl-1,4-benzoquinol methylase
VVGIDFAGEMLRMGLAKIQKAGLSSRISLVRGDATNVPLPDACVEAAMVGFGIRNVVDRERALREFARVLKPGGRLAVLEPSLANPTPSKSPVPASTISWSIFSRFPSALWSS